MDKIYKNVLNFIVVIAILFFINGIFIKEGNINTAINIVLFIILIITCLITIIYSKRKK